MLAKSETEQWPCAAALAGEPQFFVYGHFPTVNKPALGQCCGSGRRYIASSCAIVFSMQGGKRTTTRWTADRTCWISVANGAPPVECHIREISELGAKLIHKSPAEIPDDFVLNLTEDGKVRRKCKVISRAETEIDVTFSGRDAVGR